MFPPRKTPGPHGLKLLEGRLKSGRTPNPKSQDEVSAIREAAIFKRPYSNAGSGLPGDKSLGSPFRSRKAYGGRGWDKDRPK
jgi:hypothetical protein